jgi:hypothetical protein
MRFDRLKKVNWHFKAALLMDFKDLTPPCTGGP